jgi:hypothetical protein
MRVFSSIYPNDNNSMLQVAVKPAHHYIHFACLGEWTLLHEDPHDLKTSRIRELSSQTQETNSTNRIINHRYEITSIQVLMHKHSVKTRK